MNEITFPETGSYHDGQNQYLIEHLVNTGRVCISNGIIANNSKIVWNKNEYWTFLGKSKYKKYSFGELMHFIAQDVVNTTISAKNVTKGIEKKTYATYSSELKKTTNELYFLKPTDNPIINGTSIEDGWITYPQFINTTNSWIPVEQQMSPSYAGINFVDYVPNQWQLSDSIMSIDLTTQSKDKIETNLITLKCVHTKKLLRITI